MIGILDVGGGMRGAYTAGIYEYLLDRGIGVDYCLGVSAGAANMISYVANQRGRNLPFYTEYAFRREYLSLQNFAVKGSAFDFDYIYSTLCNAGGENPIDYKALAKAKCRFTVAATEADTGRAHYFTKADIQQDNYEILKATCCLPIVCKPVKVRGTYYFDGGVADPVPYRKAFEDGCKKLVVVLTRPIDFERKQPGSLSLQKWLLRKYPKTGQRLSERHTQYNSAVRELKVMEKTGAVKVIAPASTCGVTIMKKDPAGLQRLYDMGYEDGKKIEAFLRQNRTETHAVY